MRRSKSKKRGPVQSKKINYDGITFASGLERYMYMALKKAKIKAQYEGEQFVLVEGFDFSNESYERQSNGKGCTHARMHACSHAYMHACTHARTHARMHT